MTPLAGRQGGQEAACPGAFYTVLSLIRPFYGGRGLLL